MTIVIAGGSGFLGRPLARTLASRGHHVITLSRRAHAAGAAETVPWQPDGRADAALIRTVSRADAIVNLAGENLADGRWTAARKRALRDSRILSTRTLVAAVQAADPTPRVFLSGSAVGWYGVTGDTAVDESRPAGSDFLATLCIDWENEAAAVAASGCRLVIVRTGVALGRDGSALAKMILPFRLFAGGPIGPGTQYLSWIHRDDWLAMIEWLLHREDLSGVFNGTAPAPVTNREFSAALGRALGRPSWLPVPALALRALFGEMADATMLDSKRVVPARLLASGFVFRFPRIDEALADAVAGGGVARPASG